MRGPLGQARRGARRRQRRNISTHQMPLKGSLSVERSGRRRRVVGGGCGGVGAAGMGRRPPPQTAPRQWCAKLVRLGPSIGLFRLRSDIPQSLCRAIPRRWVGAGHSSALQAFRASELQAFWASAPASFGSAPATPNTPRSGRRAYTTVCRGRGGQIVSDKPKVHFKVVQQQQNKPKQATTRKQCELRDAPR